MFPLWLVWLLTIAAGCQRQYDHDAYHYQQALGLIHEENFAGPSSDPPADLPPDRPLTLRDALVLTNRHHERLGLEGERYVQAIIDRQRAKAAFLPLVEFSPAYTRRFGDAAGRPRDELTASVGGGINLFNGYSDVAALYRNAATIEQRRAILLNLQADLLLDAAATFFEALRRERSLEVLRHTAGVQRERLRDIAKRHETGLARPLDVSQAEAQEAETQSLLIAADADVRIGRAALSLLTGVAMDERPLLDEFTAPGEVAAVTLWLDDGEANRQDVVAADAGLRAAEHNVRVAVGRYYPSVTLNLQYLLTADNVATTHGWNAILAAHLPLFSAGLIEADVREAWSVLRQAKLDSSLIRREVRRDVIEAYAIFDSTRRRIIELNRRVAAAELALRQAEASYDAGLTTNLDRLTAQDELLAARLELLTQQFTHKTAYLRLLRAAGRLQEEMRVGTFTTESQRPADEE